MNLSLKPINPNLIVQPVILLLRDQQDFVKMDAPITQDFTLQCVCKYIKQKPPIKCWLHWQWSLLKWLDWVCSPVRVAGKSFLLKEPVSLGSSRDF